jgi:hypothetical protein
MKLRSDSGDSGNKRNQTMLWWCLWWDLVESAFDGSLEYGVRRSVRFGAFDRRMASVAVKMFSHLIYFIKKFYKFCRLLLIRFVKIMLQ